MSWLDKIVKKRLEELEAHPELNSDKFAEKMSTLIFRYCFVDCCHTYSFVLV